MRISARPSTVVTAALGVIALAFFIRKEINTIRGDVVTKEEQPAHFLHYGASAPQPRVRIPDRWVLGIRTGKLPNGRDRVEYVDVPRDVYAQAEKGEHVAIHVR